MSRIRGRFAVGAAALLLSACGGGSSADNPSLSKLVHFDVAPGDVILMKTTADVDGVGQLLPSDVPLNVLYAMSSTGALRPLDLVDALGRTYQPTDVAYDAIDASLGMFEFDGVPFVFRKADGALLPMNHRPALARVTGLYRSTQVAGSTFYVDGMSTVATGGSGGALLAYNKSAFATAPAGTSVNPTELFAAGVLPLPPSGIVDPSAGVAYLPNQGIVTLSGTFVRSVAEPYSVDTGGSVVYANAPANIVQCTGGASAATQTMNSVAASIGGATLTPITISRASSDSACNPETDGTFAYDGGRYLVGWANPDIPRPGAASYAFVLAGGSATAMPNLSASLAAAFPNLALSGSIGFACTLSDCAFALLSSRHTLAAFAIDDTASQFVKDAAVPVPLVNLRALEATNDFLLVGDKAVQRVKRNGTSLTYRPVTTMNGSFIAVPVN